MSISRYSFADVKQAIVHCASAEAEKVGGSALAGKIYALLLFAPEPLSLQQIAERLQVSKAAVSIQIRTMAFQGLCRKLPRQSDRRDYYALPDPIGKSFTQNMTDFWTARLQTLRQMLHALSTVSAAETEESERRILIERLSEVSALLETMLLCLAGMAHEREAQEQTLRRHSHRGATRALRSDESSNRAERRSESARKLDLHAGLPAIVTEE
ncbi:GbsR/MarR family transcriptional regulator [Paenibacillus sp. GYB003]|uniref:GbsR/MarR family transcriptional regulator n=1 Tax=Paenibacillus sp. GYB003 TaxID=2994392 RepID=UPI002F962972